MRRFAVQLLLFALPVAFYGLIGIGVPFYAGEFTPLQQVAQKQAASARPILYGRAYRDDFVTYKLYSTQLRKAHVLALGSSRVMQFRAGLFNQAGQSFYNAGGAANTVYDLRPFVHALTAAQAPQVLIVGLDQDWFNAAHLRSTQTTTATVVTPAVIDDNYLLNDSRSAMTEWLTRRWNPFEILARKDPVTQADAIGIAAIAAGNGFRNDGSRQYGQLLSAPPSTADRLADVRQRIQGGVSRYEYSAEVWAPSLDEVSRLLDECASRGITVIGFSPPYPPSIYDQMLASGHYGFMARLTEQLASLFAAKGFAYFNFSDGRLPGMTDDNFVDGLHGSELVYAQMTVQMAQALPAQLGPYIDLPALQARLAQPRASKFQLFDNN